MASLSGHVSHAARVIALDGLLFYRGVIHVVVLNVIKISPKRLSAEGEMAATGGAQGFWGEPSGLFFCVVAMNFWFWRYRFLGVVKTEEARGRGP